MMKQWLLKNGYSLDINKAGEEDAADFLAFLQSAASESETMLTAAGEFSLTLDQEQAFLRAAAASPKDLYLCGRVNGKLCAVASYTGGGRMRNAHTAELSVVVGREWWNLGIATAMMQELIMAAKNSGRFLMLHLGVREDNHAAIKVYKSLGFAPVGSLPAYFCVNGKYYDEVLMSMNLTEQA